MASPGSALKTPTSDDDTLPDEAMTGTPSDGEGLEQQGQAQYTGKLRSVLQSLSALIDCRRTTE